MATLPSFKLYIIQAFCYGPLRARIIVSDSRECDPFRKVIFDFSSFRQWFTKTYAQVGFTNIRALPSGFRLLYNNMIYPCPHAFDHRNDKQVHLDAGGRQLRGKQASSSMCTVYCIPHIRNYLVPLTCHLYAHSPCVASSARFVWTTIYKIRIETVSSPRLIAIVSKANLYTLS